MTTQTQLEKDIEAQLDVDLEKEKDSKPADVVLEVQNVTQTMRDSNDG